MQQPTPRHATIVAVTSGDESHGAVRKRAADIARRDGSSVILWALDASVSPLESPLPTDWSGDGEEEQFGDRLGPNDLIAAGREPLAKQVGSFAKRGSMPGVGCPTRPRPHRWPPTRPSTGRASSSSRQPTRI